ERGNLGSAGTLAEYHAAVIPGNGEDRPVVRPERLVELIVIILAFAEIVDDVAEMKKEGWAVRAARRHVVCHGVRHFGFVRDRARDRLLVIHFRRSRVADGME